MHVYLIVQTHVVLSKDEDGHEDDEKETCVSVHLLIGGVKYEEKQVTEVVDSIQILNSSKEEEQKYDDLNVLWC